MTGTYHPLNLNHYLTGSVEQKKNYTKQKARFMPFPVIRKKAMEVGEQIIIQGSLDMRSLHEAGVSRNAASPIQKSLRRITRNSPTAEVMSIYQSSSKPGSHTQQVDIKKVTALKEAPSSYNMLQFSSRSHFDY
jgi:hypothetical protein